MQDRLVFLDRLADAWWISTMPGLAIMLTVMSLTLLGDWLRDTLDPRLRQLEHRHPARHPSGCRACGATQAGLFGLKECIGQ